MSKMTRDKLRVRRDKAKLALLSHKKQILICAGTGCIAGGSLKIYDYMKEECTRRGLNVHVGLLEEHDDGALDLLELLLEHGGNKSALARAGHLSRPALYARLAKLQDRLGVSLDDAESRTALHVALLWHRLRGGTAGSAT